MINSCLSLRLDDAELDGIMEAFTTWNPSSKVSINPLLYQAMPAVPRIGIKETLSKHNMEVQLGVWVAGSLGNEQRHKWDTSMPMPAIAVNGHDWTFYLTFDLSGDLACSIALLCFIGASW